MASIRCVMLGALVLSSGVSAIPQSPNPLVHVLMIRDQNAPLEFKAVTSTTSNLLSSIALQSVSTKRIVWYRLGWIPTVGAECAAQRVVGTEHFIAADNPSSLTTGEYVVVHAGYAEPDSIVTFGKEHGAAMSAVQLAVIEVVFEDGAVWNRAKSSDVYSQKEMDKDARGMCANGQIRKDAL